MSLIAFSEFCEPFQWIIEPEGGFGNHLNLQQVLEVRTVLSTVSSNLAILYRLDFYVGKSQGRDKENKIEKNLAKMKKNKGNWDLMEGYLVWGRGKSDQRKKYYRKSDCLFEVRELICLENSSKFILEIHCWGLGGVLCELGE